jgi:hypothetical protein
MKSVNEVIQDTLKNLYQPNLDSEVSQISTAQHIVDNLQKEGYVILRKQNFLQYYCSNEVKNSLNPLPDNYQIDN